MISKLATSSLKYLALIRIELRSQRKEHSGTRRAEKRGESLMAAEVRRIFLHPFLRATA